MNEPVDEKKEQSETPAAEDLDPRIGEAEAKFERGDFQEASRLAEAVLDADPPGPISERAFEIIDRIGVDPLFVYVWIGTAMVLAAVVATYVL